jgi:polyhydroxyalkanoate synthesis regulator phasin
MITLVEKGVLTADEARETLEDAAAAHPDSGLAGQIIEQLMVQVNAVARSSVTRHDGD